MNGIVLWVYTATITFLSYESLVKITLICRHLNCVLSTSVAQQATVVSVCDWLRGSAPCSQMGVTVKQSCSLIRSQLCWHIYDSSTVCHVCREASGDQSNESDSTSRHYYKLYTFQKKILLLWGCSFIANGVDNSFNYQLCLSCFYSNKHKWVNSCHIVRV